MDRSFEDVSKTERWFEYSEIEIGKITWQEKTKSV